MKRSLKREAFGDLATTALAMLLGLALAATPASASPEKGISNSARGAEQTVQIEAVTVTAQKQEEAAQTVPVSITVMTEQQIEDMKIESVGEIADFVPGLMIFNNGVAGLNSPSMRGIHASAESFSVSSGLFVDGIPILSAIGYEYEMLDVERVEVLKGPQGTLYGKNTETGAINIVTRQPDNLFRGKVSAQMGADLSTEADDGRPGAMSFWMSGPIQKDKLFASVAGQYDHKDGFIKSSTTGNIVNDSEHWLGRAHFRWQPSKALDASLTLSQAQYDDGGPLMGLSETGARMFNMMGFAVSPSTDRTIASDLDGYNDIAIGAQSLKIEYRFNDDISLSSITARRVFEDKAFGDYDFTALTLVHTKKDNEYSTLSQELRLNAKSGSADFLFGLYFDDNEKQIDYETFSSIAAMAGVTSRDIEGNSYAAFTHLSYDLTSCLGVSVGLRYEEEKQEFEDSINNVTIDDTWGSVIGKVALDYQLTPATMLYASASQGFRSGGFNFTAVDPQYYSYDQEELWSFEIGGKNVFWNNRLMVNGAVYHMIVHDMQVTEAVTPMVAYLTNAAEASATGAEVEITAVPTDGLTLKGGFNYTDLAFDDFSDSLGNYEGNENPFAPKYTFNIGAQYRHASGFYGRIDLVGYGKMYLDKANQYEREAYEIVNAKIGYETERFDIYLYGKNIFDKTYNTCGYADGYYVIYSEPGEVGLETTWRF